VIVVKFGGSALDKSAWGTVLEDLIQLQPAVLVHGGGPEITRMLNLLGHQPSFEKGLRITDAATMEVVEMMLAGRVNKSLVARLQGLGARAVGVSGVDSGMIETVSMSDRIGTITAIHPELLETLMAGGFLPVVAPLGLGLDGLTYNLNGDTSAAALAVAVKADRLVFLTDVPHLLDEQRQPLHRIDPGRAQELLQNGTVAGGMIPKLESALSALRGGVQEVQILGAEMPGALRDPQAGTVLTR
jgi:acetylglutamate kinase